MLLAADTVLSISALVTVVTFTAGGVAAFLRVRGSTRDAITAASDSRIEDAQKLAAEWRASYLAERQARADAEEDAKEQRELRHAAQEQIAALKAATDLSALDKLVREHHGAVVSQLAKIDENLGKTAKILDRLVERPH